MVIPKSSKRARMAEHFDVFDFESNEGDREQIRGLGDGRFIILDHHSLDTDQFLLVRIRPQVETRRQELWDAFT